MGGAASDHHASPSNGPESLKIRLSHITTVNRQFKKYPACPALSNYYTSVSYYHSITFVWPRSQFPPTHLLLPSSLSPSISPAQDKQERDVVDFHPPFSASFLTYTEEDREREIIQTRKVKEHGQPTFFIIENNCCHGATGNFRFDLHHRFSDPVKRWATERSGTGFRPEEWPEKGTVDYYAALVDHDRVLLGRGQANETNHTLAFSAGNVTFRLSNLGFLHYATVSLGTPSMDFLVALDTGSDLSWVPCDCKSCAPTSSSNYGFKRNFDFSIYSPNTSSTSKNVPCTDDLCPAQDQCSGGANICPYTVEYASNNTSSSGVLVEDVMYLTTEDGQHEVDARIIFGCGQVQSGSFLDGDAPDGLFGLGMGNISVPSILSAAGLTTDSFSMCFGSDGVGRIIFGDKGSSDQDETPFNPRKLHPSYNISVTGLHVGPNLTDTSFSAVFDSGTSFTYLADPAYTQLSESFNSQIQDKRYSNISKLPFGYCYLLSSNDTSSVIKPSINLTMKGGGQFAVLDPLIFIFTQLEAVYCLAVVRSNNLNIIGQNFMTGQRIVFDREKLVLGWKKFNCYDIENSSTLPINRRNTTAMPPSVAGAPSIYNPKATNQTGNESQVSVLPVPPVISHSSHSCPCFIYSHLVLLILLSAIL